MRARARLLWVVGAGIVLLVAACLWLVPFDLQNERIQQAAIAGLVVALGWFAGFMLREVSQQMDRAERLRDVHRALFAEIKHNVDNLGSAEELRDFADEMLRRIVEGDGFVPFIPRERNDDVFRAIVVDIHILPRSTIDPVVQYYSQLAALDALVDDMRGDSFKTVSQQRRAAIYEDYIGLKLSALDYGREALATIEAYADDGPDAARKVSSRLREERELRRAERASAAGAAP